MLLSAISGNGKLKPRLEMKKNKIVLNNWLEERNKYQLKVLGIICA